MTTKVVMIEESEIRQLIHEELQKFFEMLNQDSSNPSEWVDSKNVPVYLNISRKTWQSYRDRKLIPFSQIGRKIWVKRSDLDTFLEKCRIESKSK